jgi:hypothetical protein
LDPKVHRRVVIPALTLRVPGFQGCPVDSISDVWCRRGGPTSTRRCGTHDVAVEPLLSRSEVLVADSGVGIPRDPLLCFPEDGRALVVVVDVAIFCGARHGVEDIGDVVLSEVKRRQSRRSLSLRVLETRRYTPSDSSRAGAEPALRKLR